MPSYCPHCNAEIERLDYEARVIETGSCSLDGDEMDSNEWETIETEYRCQECGEIIELDEIRNDGKPDPPLESENRIIRPEEIYFLKFIVCSKCGEKTELNHKNEEIVCPKCGKTINSNNSSIISI